MLVSSQQVMSVLASRIHKVVGVTPEELRGDSRKVEICDARKLFCHLLLNQIKVRASLTVIGRFLNKNHASVLHNNKVAKNLLQTDKHFTAKYRALYEECLDLITSPESTFYNNIPQL